MVQGVRALMKPVARFCIRHSLGLQDIVEAAKVALIEVAVEELGEKGKKINISRLSTITGVHRKDAVRIHREGETKEGANRYVTKVIGQWRRDSNFTTSSGKPRVLSEDEFAELVGHISKELHPRSIIFALEEADMLQKTNKGLRLKAPTYSPKKNLDENFRMLSRDIDDLITGVMENIFSDVSDEELPNYHANTFFDNIDATDVPKIRKWLLRQSTLFHQRAEKYLSKYDLDIVPDEKKDGGERVALVTFTKS